MGHNGPRLAEAPAAAVDVPTPNTTVVRFGPFDLDSKSGELRKGGDVVKLPPQPLKVLALLVRRSGEVVTRDEIRQHVWTGDTFVDFSQSLNTCMRQIREALGDDAETPRYIQTLPRRGYRFLLPIEPSQATPADPVTRLIVLPFRILRPDPDTDFLAFSLPDAVTSSLSGLDALVVRSSIVASRFGSGPLDPKVIAAEADVDFVLTGSLLRSAEQLRVSTQLTEVPSGTLRWSHSSQVSLGDIFSVQDELATRIVDSLSVPLTTREHGMLKRDVPSSARAYEYYLRGNQLSLDSKQWSVAQDLYLRCVEADPRYAPAWARLGRTYHVIGKYVDSDARESMDRAEMAFTRALDLNPELPLAHKLYAQLEVDLGRAEHAMARLLKRAPAADSELFAGLVSACQVLRTARSLDRRRFARSTSRTASPHERRPHLVSPRGLRPYRQHQARGEPVHRGSVARCARPIRGSDRPVATTGGQDADPNARFHDCGPHDDGRRRRCKCRRDRPHRGVGFSRSRGTVLPHPASGPLERDRPRSRSVATRRRGRLLLLSRNGQRSLARSAAWSVRVCHAVESCAGTAPGSGSDLCKSRRRPDSRNPRRCSIRLTPPPSDAQVGAEGRSYD